MFWAIEILLASPQGNIFIEHFSEEKRFSVTCRFIASRVITRFVNGACTGPSYKISLSVSPPLPTASSQGIFSNPHQLFTAPSA